MSAAGRGKCALVAFLSALLVFVSTTARVRYAFGGNWTAVFYTGADLRVPSDLDAHTYRVANVGYDGQFYRYLAHDPFFQKGYSRFVDSPRLRFGRILVPFFAWLLGAGQSRWIDGAFIAVELFFLAAGVYWCALLLARRGRSPLWGLLFLTVPATLASFDRMLVDGPLVALFAAFILYCSDERWTAAWVVAMLAALTRETGLLLGAALVADRLLDRDWRRAAWFAASALPAIAWHAYLALRLPPDWSASILTPPAWGILRRLFWLRAYPDPRLEVLLRVTDVLAVLGLIASMILAVRWLLKLPIGPVTLSVGFFAALGLVLGSPAHMTDAFGFARPVSPLLLWVMLEAAARGRWSAMAPPLLVSASVALVVAAPAVTIVKGVLGLN